MLVVVCRAWLESLSHKHNRVGRDVYGILSTVYTSGVSRCLPGALRRVVTVANRFKILSSARTWADKTRCNCDCPRDGHVSRTRSQRASRRTVVWVAERNLGWVQPHLRPRAPRAPAPAGGFHMLLSSRAAICFDQRDQAGAHFLAEKVILVAD
jgi:hypothetical protein